MAAAQANTQRVPYRVVVRDGVRSAALGNECARQRACFGTCRFVALEVTEPSSKRNADEALTVRGSEHRRTDHSAGIPRSDRAGIKQQSRHSRDRGDSPENDGRSRPRPALQTAGLNDLASRDDPVHGRTICHRL